MKRRISYSQTQHSASCSGVFCKFPASRGAAAHHRKCTGPYTHQICMRVMSWLTRTLSQALSLLAIKFCFLLASQGKKGVTTQHREESFAEGGGRKGLYKLGTRMLGWWFELVPLSSFPISYLSVSSLFDYYKRNLKSAFTDSQIKV